MIDSICYSKDWITSRRSIFKRNDPSIIEKTIYAFSLLEKMRAVNIDFIFKGGSSLLLILKDFRRFSIDIDIIYEGNIDDLEKKLENILNYGVFNSIEKDERNNNIIPKAHYKFFYHSQINKRKDNILLDVLFEKNVYPEVNNITINHPIIKVSGEKTEVTVPTADAILGDKLTAFAPNTIGIKYATGKHIEIIKQLFDIGSLFDNCTAPDIILKSFLAISNKEISYRKISSTPEEVLNDIFQTALTLGMNGPIYPDNFAELKRGVQSFSPYVFGNRFSLIDAVNKAAKAAYISKILKEGNKIEKYHTALSLRNATINNSSYKRLNKIKKTDPEAFYYFMNSCEIP